MHTRRLIKPVAVLALASAVVATGLWQAASATEDHFSFQQAESDAKQAQTAWTGTWSASPQEGPASFEEQTLRQIVHTSIAGTAARVQLSNAFGKAPLTIANVRLAQRGAGSSIDPDTDVPATFGGRTSVTIPAGGKAVSDEVAFPVTQRSDVVVSLYVPKKVSRATQHAVGGQTGFIAAGDVTGRTTLPGAETTTSYTFLSGLDVRNDSAEGALVALGASITDGVAADDDANRRWTNDLATRLSRAGRAIGVLNQGISGNELLSDGAGDSAIKRFQRDVLDQSNVKWVVFADDPINDVNTEDPPSGKQLTAGLTKLIDAAHQAGVQFFCATLTPFKPTSGWTQAGEDSRSAYNDFVRSKDSGCDAVIDFEAATRDKAKPLQFKAAFDAGDHLHPNTEGLQAMADAVPLTVFGPPPPAAVVSFRARNTGKIVTAEDAGGRPLIADRDAAQTWEQFDKVDAGEGTVALRSHANGKFVSVPELGAVPVIANAASIDTAEQFKVHANPDGTVALLSMATNRYLSTSSGQLTANAERIGTNERFTMFSS